MTPPHKLTKLGPKHRPLHMFSSKSVATAKEKSPLISRSLAAIQNYEDEAELADMAETANPGSDVPPNQTIYINNLNEKIKLDGRVLQFCPNFFNFCSIAYSDSLIVPLFISSSIFQN